jgi:hypothetical protein
MFVATRRYVSSVPRTTDAFGAALLDVLAGGDGRHAIERDDGRVDSMNATSYFATADTWTGEIVEALSQMHGRVLDVGCGAGRTPYTRQASAAMSLALSRLLARSRHAAVAGSTRTAGDSGSRTSRWMALMA